ncbi:MAG TPA: D-alanine--D-alanine ligase family protein [Solirubrobacteraceae bacterium]|nr:D-alanine--D-alanine ligase family protein [Solirubrobacteraceae bacterium]
MIVAVLSGGRSSEHEVSLAGGAAVASGLRAAGHEVLEVTLERDGTWRHDGEELALVPGRGLLGADVVFPVLHGPFGEDGTVQGALELLDVPYVGSGVLASAVCLDKIVAKDLMARAGIRQVDYAGVRAARWELEPDAVLEQLAALGLPVFVKPARLGSSVGIAKVSDASALAPALDAAFDHDPCVIVEAMSTGIEVECSVLGSARAARASEPGEIVLASEWYDFAAKYEPGGMQLVVPARISATARERVRSLALEAFARLGCAGLARADFFVEGDDVLLNELNTMPGFTATSVYAKLWEAGGLAYDELVTRLCELAIERHAQERAYRF